MHMLTLLRRGHELASATQQLQILDSTAAKWSFAETLDNTGMGPLRSRPVEILQMNLGKLCNMTCQHCHVDAGPDRREVMTESTIDACLSALVDNPQIHTLDLTGGAPEMNPGFCHLVQTARELNRHVIDRCNLTILQAPGFEHLGQFLADQQVEIVASLPCYLPENADAQRGSGSFHKSIAVLRQLNALGYGVAPELPLTLVYNPVGATLPPSQSTLEQAYKQQLASNYDVTFTRLYTITNMPISRFLEHLVQIGQFEEYMQTLIDAFNPATVEGLMCRNTISVGWDGRLFDCDFNQMLEIGIQPPHAAPQQQPSGHAPELRIETADLQQLTGRSIATGPHCFGCTAGSGSGCQGAIQ